MRKLDEQFHRLESVAEDSPRPYHLVVLSDHGQSGGPTFLQRYGFSLEDLVKQHVQDRVVQAILQTSESWGHVNVVMNDIVQNDSRTGRAIERFARKNMQDGELVLGKDDVDLDEDLEEDAQLVVLASGNLGLVYSTDREERLLFEELEEVLPGLLEGIAAHEGIGWVMVKSTEHDAIVIGPNGRYYLKDGRVEGANPLEGFGPNAARHLRRYNEFPDAPDLYINSFYDAETNEVAAFEELIGCHGGMGGYQTRPFILHPKDLKISQEEMIGAASVYDQFKEWLAELHGANGSTQPSTATTAAE